MRTDILNDKKSVHLKLDRDVHTGLRTKLFQHNLSMQELFEEFASLVISDDHKACKILEQVVVKKVEISIDGHIKKKRKKTLIDIPEKDRQTIYSMIESAKESTDDDESAA